MGALAAVEPRPGSQGAAVSLGGFMSQTTIPLIEPMIRCMFHLSLELVKRVSGHHETCLAVSSVSPKRSMNTSPPLGLLYIIVGGEGATNFPRDELHIGFKKQLIELLGLSCA